ncbi:MAG TPA: MarR family transcriptional regulator [Gemmatimonadales bacterium]
MTTRLQAELKQGKPFASPEHEAILSIARTASVLEHGVVETLKPFGITPTQYNVLRILRGAGREGLCRNAVRDRLVARVPDATRLLDRLAEAGLVARDRDTADRRYVTTCITPAGLDLLARLDQPIAQLHRHQLGRLGARKLGTLIDLLADVREAAARPE